LFPNLLKNRTINEGAIVKIKSMRTCVFLGMILLAGRHLGAQTVTPPSLVGSWQLSFVPVSPAPTAVPAVQIPGLVTFTADGTLVETDATEVTPGAAATNAATSGTPGHGIWQPGPAAGNFFIQFMSLVVNHAGVLQDRRVVTITGAIDNTGNHFAGNFESHLISPSGHVTGTTMGSFTADRLVHPALP
jgi:hypothetical protein